MKEYLVKLTIPSVQEIITQSRKLIDLHGSSSLIPDILSKTFKKFVDKEKVEFLIPSEDVIKNYPENITNVAYIIYKTDSEEEVKEFCEKLENEIYNALTTNLTDNLLKKLKDFDIEKYEKVIHYQVKNSIRVIYSAVEIEKDLKKAKNEVDKIVAYIKGTIHPDTSVIEGIDIYDKEKNMYFEKDFLEFLENQENVGYIHVLGPYICSICGKRTIIGSSFKNLNGKDFWEKLQKNKSPLISEGERLCGFCLSKRIYKYDKTNFKSVVHYAIRSYDKEIEEELLSILNKYYINDIQNIYEENHKNLPPQAKEELTRFFEKNGEPSKYYALLMADGDSMGEKVESAFENKEKVNELTKKLSEKSLEFKEIIEQNRGKTIYTGGDDVLAILPQNKALDSFKEISEKFKDISSMSGGVIISHYKIPLNYVLKELRKAENIAKKEGKDGVYIKYIKHSLSSAGCFIKTNEIDEFKKLIDIMEQKDFPNTFVSQLETLLQPYSTTESLSEEDKEIIKNLITYLINKKDFSKKDEFKNLVLNQNFKDTKTIVEKLKVAKFLAKRGER